MGILSKAAQVKNTEVIKTEKEILVLSLDFIFGPISKDFQDENGNEITGIKIVDNDQVCQELDKEINNLLEVFTKVWAGNWPNIVFCS